MVAGAVAMVMVMAGVVAGGWVLMTRGATGASAHAVAVELPAPTATTSTSSSSAPVTVTPDTQLSPLRGVAALPGGLLCVDLQNSGYGYSAALRYWVLHGRPDRMDENLNGIPCETVFSNPVVLARLAEAAAVGDLDPNLLPEGLMCRDLVAGGIAYADAVSYWIQAGSPARMDADLDGAPCETVYPYEEVLSYWAPTPGQGSLVYPVSSGYTVRMWRRCAGYAVDNAGARRIHWNHTPRAVPQGERNYFQRGDATLVHRDGSWVYGTLTCLYGPNGDFLNSPYFSAY